MKFDSKDPTVQSGYEIGYEIGVFFGKLFPYIAIVLVMLALYFGFKYFQKKKKS